MEVKPLTDQLNVSGQISIDDVAALQAAGVKSIICNRPDHEEANQVLHSDIANAAEKHGIAFVFMPITPGQMTQDNVNEFSQSLNTLDKPIHAYCRSGMRSTSLWGLSQTLNGLSKERVLQTAAEAGYDLSKLL